LIRSGRDATVPPFARRFSRMRSKMKTVSLTEYPTSVRNAATTGRLISYPNNEKSPSVMIVSCTKAMTAANPHWNSNRIQM
jgi:hypothetical protein